MQHWVLIKKIKVTTEESNKDNYEITHTDPLFSELKLNDLYKHQLGIFMYKSINGQLPDNLTSLHKRTKNVHNHNLRNYNG